MTGPQVQHKDDLYEIALGYGGIHVIGWRDGAWLRDCVQFLDNITATSIDHMTAPILGIPQKFDFELPAGYPTIRVREIKSPQCRASVMRGLRKAEALIEKMQSAESGIVIGKPRLVK